MLRLIPGSAAAQGAGSAGALATSATAAVGAAEGSDGAVHPEYLEVVRRHAGLYADKAAHPEFVKVVLAVATNFAYYDFLRNWECMASRLGLDWVVIALDRQTYDAVGPGQALEAQGVTTSSNMEFKSKNFNIMSSNTLRSVMHILKSTGYDVVFADSDNVFIEDPFAPGASFGDMIRKQAYDYVYQPNWSGPHWDQKQGYEDGVEIHEGNTGIYFASAARNKDLVVALFEAALAECDNNEGTDGQTNFWNALRKLRKAEKPCFALCGNRSCREPGVRALEFCEMSPWRHRTGWGVPFDQVWPEGHTGTAISYHANFVVGREAKIQKMTGMKVWVVGEPSCPLHAGHASKSNTSTTAASAPAASAEEAPVASPGAGAAASPAPQAAGVDASASTAAHKEGPGER